MRRDLALAAAWACGLVRDPVGGGLCRTFPAQPVCRKAFCFVTQLVLPLETRSAFGRADFIVAPGNRRRSPSSIPGPAGRRRRRRFMVRPPAASRTWPRYGLPGRKRWCWRRHSSKVSSPPVPLVVENVGPGTAETPLFALLERGAPLLLTAQAPPADWPFTPSGPEIPGQSASGLRALGAR